MGLLLLLFGQQNMQHASPAIELRFGYEETFGCQFPNLSRRARFYLHFEEPQPSSVRCSQVEGARRHSSAVAAGRVLEQRLWRQVSFPSQLLPGRCANEVDAKTSA